MINPIVEKQVGGVVFERSEQGLYAVFGPLSLYRQFENSSDISVVTHNELEELPAEFHNGAYGGPNRLRSGAEFGLDPDVNVLFLPWSLLPKEFNVLNAEDAKW